METAFDVGGIYTAAWYYETSSNVLIAAVKAFHSTGCDSYDTSKLRTKIDKR